MSETPTGQTGRIWGRLRARLSRPRYLGNHGQWMHRDPTYGQIDADIQRQAADLLDDPSDLGRRVAIENTLQRRRDERIAAETRRGCDPYADGPSMAGGDW